LIVHSSVGFVQVSTRLLVSLYDSSIQGAYTGGDFLAKAFRAFRFDPELYARFKELVAGSGLTVTEAFERFMEACVSARAVTFPTGSRQGVEAEARVLLAWLRKGKRFYYGPEGDEDQSVESRLLALLNQVQDDGLRREMEEDLKKLSQPR